MLFRKDIYKPKLCGNLPEFRKGWVLTADHKNPLRLPVFFISGDGNLGKFLYLAEIGIHLAKLPSD